jgi:ABC-type nickel/cobalt efflux system permease component RcnA
MAFASEYILLALLFSSPRTNPTLPTTALPKPTGLLIMIIGCLVLHPVAILAGVAWQRTREKEGRIRLREEVEEAEAEADAEAVAHGHSHAHAHAHGHGHADRSSRA